MAFARLVQAFSFIFGEFGTSASCALFREKQHLKRKCAEEAYGSANREDFFFFSLKHPFPPMW